MNIFLIVFMKFLNYLFFHNQKNIDESDIYIFTNQSKTNKTTVSVFVITDELLQVHCCLKRHEEHV